jgi:hypothetical protein
MAVPVTFIPVTSVDNNVNLTDLGDDFTQATLSGLAFWKANVGVAFRW